MKSKPVTQKHGNLQRDNMRTQGGGPWKGSAKQDGCRGQGPAARDSGKAMFAGVMPGSGDVGGQEPAGQRKTKVYSGGRSEVQKREKGVRY